MKIINEGVKPVSARQFECPDCHCIFEAERGEYTAITEEFMGTEYHAVCPFCGRDGYMMIRSYEYTTIDCMISFYLAGLPDKSGIYLVFGAEYNLFSGEYDKPQYMILEYSEKEKAWNTKASIKVYAWAELPDLRQVMGKE
jgi:hypothetical protein